MIPIARSKRMIKASDWRDRSSFTKDSDEVVDYFFEYDEEEESEESVEIPQDVPPASVAPAPSTETVPQVVENDGSDAVSDDSRSDVEGAGSKNNPVIEPQEDIGEAGENNAGDDTDEVQETSDDLTVPQSGDVESTGVTPNEVPDDTEQEDEENEAIEDTPGTENHDGNDSFSSDSNDEDQKEEVSEEDVSEESDSHDDTDDETIGDNNEEEDLPQASTKYFGDSSLLNWKVFQV